MNRKTASAIIAVGLICFLTGWSFSEYTWLMSLHRNPTLRANVFFAPERYGVDARMVQGNIIVDRGENLTRNLLCRPGLSMNITAMAVGNITGLDKADATLTDVYYDPTDSQYPNSSMAGFNVVEWKNGEDAAFNMTFKWTFEETVNLDSAAAYFWNTTYAYAMANFPGGAQTFNNGENLTVRYVFTVNAND